MVLLEIIKIIEHSSWRSNDREDKTLIEKSGTE